MFQVMEKQVGVLAEAVTLPEVEAQLLMTQVVHLFFQKLVRNKILTSLARQLYPSLAD